MNGKPSALSLRKNVKVSQKMMIKMKRPSSTGSTSTKKNTKKKKRKRTRPKNKRKRKSTGRVKLSAGKQDQKSLKKNLKMLLKTTEKMPLKSKFCNTNSRMPKKMITKMM